MTTQELYHEFAELKVRYPDLVCRDITDGIAIEGNLELYAECNDIPITDTYQIRIKISRQFPAILPEVWELTNKIPRKYGHFFSNGTLCLGVKTEILLNLIEYPSLLYFVEHFLVNYLYSASYWMKYAAMPFGERSHGDGVFEFYKERLDVETDGQVLSILKAVTGKNFQYRGHLLCPCMSGAIMRKCKHKKFLLELSDPTELLLYKRDYEDMRGIKWNT
jgi:hypothetical protein